jgi:3-deoxy-D-manno-octulosonate 8-phosphate phosphatase (KDO 8-P phosphatase)
MKQNFKEKLPNVKIMIFDVDGVFTDGSLTLLENGEQVRTFNIKDGYAIQQAVKSGLQVAVITGARSMAVKDRLNYLGVSQVYLGAHNKIECYEELKYMHNFNDSEALYMGDDIPDLEIMKKVGLPTAPKDAVIEILNEAIYVSHYAGGKGCVRDIVEQVLRSKNLWQNIEQ